ncbi:hypothetical protein AAFC00_004670 [Neodothiora populina]|uniref:Dynactin subunit 4 n=1 Tax=Neodothiora populina TaxID=2781224 RepID=A0ABR3P337_9PEZI
MASAFPYSHVACPCTSLTASAAPTTQSRRTSYQPLLGVSGAEPINSTFNSHDARANFSLYPYDHLLYCDECHQIRCPRCWTEEVVNWYCPSCLFEVPSSVVKSDGNRCTRNCYNCPSCTAPLSTNGLESQSKDHLSPQDTSQPSGPFILSCPCCDWSSLDVGIQLSKPTKITEQLHRLRARQASRQATQSQSGQSSEITLKVPGSAEERSEVSPDQGQFAALVDFYKNQLSESAGLGSNSMAGASLSSPDNLARIMSLYGGLSYTALKKSREKPQPMREAISPAEGLVLSEPETEHAQRIEKLRQQGHAATASLEQRRTHPFNYEAQFCEDLWPIATLLRTRRSKRCRVCRHILTKPEPKIGSTRYKIRLLAQNHIPRLSLRLFTNSSTFTPIPLAAFALTPLALKSARESDYERLRPSLPVQFLLTLTNPLFDPVRVTLATPAITPGPVESRVTILCPSLEIGAAGDLWDEALNGTGSSASAQAQRPGSKDSNRDGEERQPEAGKVWERGRNWTTVVMEVVPGSVQDSRAAKSKLETPGEPSSSTSNRSGKESSVDEDVLEIPVFVRVEWETELTAEDAAASGTAKGTKESRELAFWTILGAGRIAA